MTGIGKWTASRSLAMFCLKFMRTFGHVLPAAYKISIWLFMDGQSTGHFVLTSNCILPPRTGLIFGKHTPSIVVGIITFR